MKYINFKRYKFIKIFKNLNFKVYNFSKIYKNFKYKHYNFLQPHKYLNIQKLNPLKIYKSISLKKFKIVPLYIIGFFILSAFIYLSIPIFSNYNETQINKRFCKDLKIQCQIKGKIYYSFIPSPRIKIKNLEIYDLINSNKIYAKIPVTEIKIPLNSIVDINNFNYKKIELQNPKINLDFKILSKYKKQFLKNISLKKINVKNGNIEIFDGDKYVANLKNVKFKYKYNKKINKFYLNADFLGDKILIKLRSLKDKKNSYKDLVIKLNNYNFLSKVEFLNQDTNTDVLTGKVLIKKDKNRISGVFDFKDKEIVVKNTNLRNSFVDGKISGQIKFSPFFNFILNTELNSLNFNKLHNLIVSLNDNNKKNLFRVSNKINGQLNLSTDKIFSKHTLINSFESKLQFINGNIIIDRLLLSLGKLGASDFVGVINNDKKFTNFKFENNIFIDNSKKFYNKFGVFNKPKTPYNLFVKGNLDLANLNLNLYEVMTDKELNTQDITFIEREFNNIILDNGYESLFNFSNIKEFVKLITLENN